uniref:Translational initiation factor 1 n=1 Tax=Allium tuberosum TaxID=4683 RepID=A0A6M8U173_ALLTU|nr:translational initiation factor 1 [Allium tuberosum]
MKRLRERLIFMKVYLLNHFQWYALRIRLYNEDLILGSISGRIRRSLIRTLPGNRIKIEIRQYYSHQGTYNL